MKVIYCCKNCNSEYKSEADAFRCSCTYAWNPSSCSYDEAEVYYKCGKCGKEFRRSNLAEKCCEEEVPSVRTFYRCPRCGLENQTGIYCGSCQCKMEKVTEKD